jgi:hypothetical protein
LLIKICKYWAIVFCSLDNWKETIATNAPFKESKTIMTQFDYTEDETVEVIVDNRTVDTRYEQLSSLGELLNEYVQKDMISIRAIAWLNYLQKGRGCWLVSSQSGSDDTFAGYIDVDSFLKWEEKTVNDNSWNEFRPTDLFNSVEKMRFALKSYDPIHQAVVCLLLTDDTSPVRPTFFVASIAESAQTGAFCLEEFNKRNKSKTRSNTEQKLETDLYDWLLNQGVEVESQVKTSNHRLDLWIPGKLMLELKAGKVSGDDVCQAIDYYSTYQRSILLVGKGVTTSASRGIEGFNRSTNPNAIVFMTWNAVKLYLKSFLCL